MSDPTPPAVSDAMREAVARLPEATYDDLARACRQTELDNRRLTSEIARLTGERDEIREAFMRVAEAIGAPASERLDVEVRDRFNLMAGKLDEANAMLARLTQGRDNPPVTNGQRVSFSDFLHANTRAEKAEAERDAFREAASEEAWALAAAQDDLKHARHDRDGWMESALHAQKRVAGLEAELRRQMSGGAGRDVVNLLEKLKTTEELREAAEKTYCTWACGEDCHKELRELGRVLGFTADPA